MHKIFQHKSIFSLGIFFAFTLLPHLTHAAVLLPGNINTCGELAAPGTYTISADFDADTTLTNETCFIISSDGVTLDGANHTITTTLGTLAIDARQYTIQGDITSGLVEGASAFTNLTIQNLTISNFTTSINANGNNITNGSGGNAGSITITSSTLTDITANGGDGTDSNSGLGGDITISNDSSVGEVSSIGGVYGQSSFEIQSSGSGYFNFITSTPLGDVYAIKYNDDSNIHDIYKQTAGSGDYVSQNAGSLNWQSITSTPSGDVYAVVDGGDIYKQTAGQGAFVAQNAGDLGWRSITSTPSGDVYAVVDGGDIYKQTGPNIWEAQGVGNQNWRSITSTSNGDVYAIDGDFLYKQAAGQGLFEPQYGAINDTLNWTYIHTTSLDDIYIVSDTEISKRTAGQVNFETQTLEGQYWRSITSTPSGDVYAIGRDYGDIYKQTGGQGAFVAQGVGNYNWSSITSTPSGDIYVVYSIFDISDASIYKQTAYHSLGGTITIDNSLTEDITAETITISSTDVDLSNNTYTADTLDITYSNTLTTTNTLLAVSSHFIVNTDDFGPYTGDFPVLPGPIDNCATLILPGTYTLTQDITDISDTCFTIQSDNITIDGNNHTLSALTSTTTPAIDARNSQQGASAFTNLTIQNLTISNFTTSINANGNNITNGSGGNAGSITITSSTLTDITANGGDGTDSNSGLGGDITISNDSSVGEVSSNGGIYGSEWEAQNAGSQYWASITSTPSGDVYAATYGGDIYKQTAGSGDYVAQNAVDRSWQSITSTPSGDVYAVWTNNLNLGNIYKQTAGQGAFVAQIVGQQLWSSITSTPSGDVYAVTAWSGNDDIYKQTAGQGAFVAQNAGNLPWYSITSTPSGDVYAVVSGGDIYKQTAGQGAFVAKNAGNQYWSSITSTPSGDVFAVVSGDDIYKQIAGQGSFVAQGAGNQNWQSITSTPSGDVYAVANGGDIYKQTEGQGAFVAQGVGQGFWVSITSTPSGDVYAVVSGGDIYKQTAYHSLGGTITIEDSLTEDITAEIINISGTNIDITDNTYRAPTVITLEYNGTIQTNTNTYIYTQTGDFLVNNTIYTYPTGEQGYNGVYNPVIYYFSNITDTDWNTLTNWCTGAYCGEQGATQATRLPTSVDQVIVNGDILSNSGPEAIANTVVFTNTSINAISIDATQGVSYTDSSSLSATTTSSIISFEDTASLIGKVYTTIARFYNDASSAVLGVIKGISRPFVAQNAGNQYKPSITSTPSGDVYAVVYNGDIYKQTAGQGSFVAQNAGSESWYSITSTPSGDVYAVVYNGDIYKQTAGQGSFVAQNAGSESWYSITSTPSGDVYAVVLGYDIYKQTAGQGAFVAQNAGNQYWTSITSTPSGDVYAVVYNGDIYKQTAGQGAFVAQNAGNLGWQSITSTPSGDVYVVDNNFGDIYKQTEGQGAFVAQNAGNQYWTSITSTPSGDVYAVVYNGDIYKQTAGQGSFVAQNAGSLGWTFITSTPSGDVYVVVNGGDIYKQSVIPTAERIYTESATTTRNFTTEGSIDTWTIIAQRAVGSFVDVIVNLTDAVYDLTKNIFKAFTGATFISGTDINNLSTPVVPELSYTLPTHNQTVTKWLPSINWGDATLCEYSYDNWTTTNTATCSNNGSDIERPTGGSHTLSLRATNQYGSFKEEDIPFTYDNTVPTYTLCGSDLLDEATRPYYYLASNITANCTATVNTELRGTTTATTTGYTLTGNITATAKNISLKLITITGTITTSGTSNGQSAGSITIATSTTGALYANGANGTADGGDGGDITITNSIGITASSTPIFANGGNSTSCGNGGDGGQVTLTHSTYGTITAEGGDASTQGCSNQSRVSGQRRTPTITGEHSSQSQGGNTNTNTPTPTPTPAPSRSSSGTLRNIVNSSLVPLTFNPLTPFTPFTSSFKPQTLGNTNIPDPFKNFNAPGAVSLTTLPVNFLTNISKFLFAPLPHTITDALKNSPKLEAHIASLGITKEQDIAFLASHPAQLPSPTEDIPGLFIITSGNQTLTSYATYDTSVGGLAHLINTSPNQSLTLSFIPQSTGPVSATYLNQTLTFTPPTPYTSTSFITPTSPGRYVLKTSSSPLPLLIDVKAPIQPTPQPTKPWGVFNFIYNWFSR